MVLDRSILTNRSAERDRNGVCPHLLDLLRSFIVMRGYMEKSILKPSDMSLRRAGQLNRISNHCIEHGLNIRGRTRNGSENLTSRRLLLQRLGEIAVAFLKLFKQPHVFN